MGGRARSGGRTRPAPAAAFPLETGAGRPATGGAGPGAFSRHRQAEAAAAQQPLRPPCLLLESGDLVVQVPKKVLQRIELVLVLARGGPAAEELLEGIGPAGPCAGARPRQHKAPAPLPASNLLPCLPRRCRPSWKSSCTSTARTLGRHTFSAQQDHSAPVQSNVAAASKGASSSMVCGLSPEPASHGRHPCTS